MMRVDVSQERLYTIEIEGVLGEHGSAAYWLLDQMLAGLRTSRGEIDERAVSVLRSVQDGLNRIRNMEAAADGLAIGRSSP